MLNSSNTCQHKYIYIYIYVYDVYTHTHTHMCVYMYIYIYIYIDRELYLHSYIVIIVYYIILNDFRPGRARERDSRLTMSLVASATFGWYHTTAF